MIPIGTNKVIIGHNVAFDRSKLREEYEAKKTGNIFIDTMSMHNATHGLMSEQRVQYKRKNFDSQLQRRVGRRFYFFTFQKSILLRRTKKK